MLMRRLVVVCVLAALAAPGAASAWSWPVEGPVLRPFVFGSDPYAGGQHRGIDVGARVGESVRAPVGGAVSFAGSVPNGGRALTIRTDDGYSVTLLQLGTLAVERGDAVAEGARVATVGESADAVTHAPHVHLGVRRTDDEDGYLDPLRFLAARERPPAAAPSAPAAPEPPVSAPASPPPPAERAPAPEPARRRHPLLRRSRSSVRPPRRRLRPSSSRRRRPPLRRSQHRRRPARCRRPVG